MPSRLAVTLSILLLPTFAQAQVQVLATIKPLQLLVAAVMGDTDTSKLLIDPGLSPHHYALKPSDRVAMASADLVIWVGEELETYLAGVMTTLNDDNRSNNQGSGRSKEILRMDQLDSLTLLPLRGEHGAAGRGNRIDPHLWLHTGNARIMAAAIGEALSAMFPDRRAEYETNVQRFEDQLERLHQETVTRLQPILEQPYVVYHDAIQYFEAEFGLHHALALVPDPEQQPGIRQTLQTRNAVVQLQPGCLLTDNTANQNTIETLLGGHQLTLVELDLLGTHVTADRDGYVQLMHALAVDVAGCLMR